MRPQRWVQDEPEWLLADARSFRRRGAAGGLRGTRFTFQSLSVLGACASGARRSNTSGVESGKPRMEFRLNGTAGALRFDAFQKQLLFAEAGSPEEKKLTISRAQSRGWQVEADFIRSIREGKPSSLTSFEQGLRYMIFTEMVADSVAAGSRIVRWEDY